MCQSAAIHGAHHGKICGALQRQKNDLVRSHRHRVKWVRYESAVLFYIRIMEGPGRVAGWCGVEGQGRMGTEGTDGVERWVTGTD